MKADVKNDPGTEEKLSVFKLLIMIAGMIGARFIIARLPLMRMSAEGFLCCRQMHRRQRREVSDD